MKLCLIILIIVLSHAYCLEHEDGVLKTIKYNSCNNVQRNSLMTSSTTSACARCAICMAVSNRLENALKLIDDLESFTADSASQLLKSVCDHSFVDYGLREYDHKRILTRQLPNLDNVPNSLDGLWPQLLTDTCNQYLNTLGAGNLISKWLQCPGQNMTQILCRSNGLFSDCLNINEGVIKVELPWRPFKPITTVFLHYPCA